MKDSFCVIMAGGIGSRFWPASTIHKPKQFLDIMGVGKPLLQITYERNLKIFPAENIYVITNRRYKNLVIGQLKNIKEKQIICEPYRKNTAPCVAYACHIIAATHPKANVVVSPSDHIIKQEKKYIELIKLALSDARAHKHILTLGIRPDRPDTGYGYIHFDSTRGRSKIIKKVISFTEKPGADLARQFVGKGNYCWNSGIFISNVVTMIDAYAKFLPDMNSLFKKGRKIFGNKGENIFIETVYRQCKNISIDNGIIEKADNIHVIVSDFGWSDLGTWGSLYGHLKTHKKDNVIIRGNVLANDTRRCLISTDHKKSLVVQGLEDYIVVEASNAILICRMEDEQKIKQIVEKDPATNKF